MPIYDYRCSACGHLTEVVHGINDHGPRFCPECGAEGTMSKGFTLPAIHFKGSGWAKKDRSAASSSKSTAEADTKESSKAAPGDGGSKDEKATPTASPAPVTSEPKAPASGNAAD